MKLINTSDPQFKPSVVMMVYGEGGVGKTTFASTANNPLIIDCENGTKYFGLRGIKTDAAVVETWNEIEDKNFVALIKSAKYDTIVVDPIGELMSKLKTSIVATGGSKYVQKDGSLTMAGWGFMKDRMRSFVKFLRDTGKNVILVAHLEEKEDENRIVKRPKIETKIVDDLVAIVDIVAYMTVVNTGTDEKRILMVDPGSDKYTAKDRTGQLGKVIEPDFSKIVKAIQGVENYSWAKPLAPANNSEIKPEELPKEEVKEEVKEAQPETKKPLANPHLEAARAKVAAKGGQSNGQ